MNDNPNPTGLFLNTTEKVKYIISLFAHFKGKKELKKESCKIKWPKKMTHIENSDIMLSDQTKHRKE